MNDKVEINLAKHIVIVIINIMAILNISCMNNDRFLALTYEEFDQTDNKGWREYTYPNKVDYKKAAEVIEYYLMYKDGLIPDEIAMLNFHAGQGFAFVNDYSKAQKHLSLSFTDGSDTNGKYWNYYVQANIAFLNRDLNSLLRIKGKMESLPLINGMNPNLAFVKSLISNIHKPYLFAYRDAQNNYQYEK